MKKLAEITCVGLLLLGSSQHAATSSARFSSGAAPTNLNQASDLAKKARAVLAQTAGRIELPGLSKSVEVIRDTWGIAHIYAAVTKE